MTWEGGAGAWKVRGNVPAHSSPFPSPNLVCSLANLGGLSAAQGPTPWSKGHSAEEGSQPEGVQQHGLPLDLQPQSGHPGCTLAPQRRPACIFPSKQSPGSQCPLLKSKGLGKVS